MEYKSNNNVVYSCKYHVVWCPKYRRKVLMDDIAVRMDKLVRSICAEIMVDVIELEVMPDHVHLLIEVDPQFGIDRAVRQIKGKTSRILRQLQYKCQWQGKVFVQIEQTYPSTQICSECGYQNRSLRKHYKEIWKCPQCGAIRDIDWNAAQNILVEGLRILNTV